MMKREERLVTAAELEQMQGGEDFELVRGRLVPVTPAGDVVPGFRYPLASLLEELD